MTGPDIGEDAPDFELRDQHGQSVRLSSLRGARAAVLVFYPSAFSPVCSNELAALQEASPRMGEGGVQLLAISCDPMFTLRTFSEREQIDFPMLSDFWPHGAVSSAYGVFDRDFGCSKRSTFVVDREGRIRWLVHNAMPDPRSVDDYFDALADLRTG